MSFQITTAFVNQFGSNIYTLAQQKGSRLRPAVRQESQKGNAEFFDRIGSVTAIKKTGRHSNTPQLDTPHSRRMVTMSDYEWADLIDDQDRIRTLIDPTNAYVQAAMWALGRALDDVIIAAADGTANTGVDGTTAVVFPTSQMLVPVAAGASANLNINALIQAKQFFDAADVPEEIPRYIAIGSSELASLLKTTQVTSADYNTVKALVAGNIDTFMGFKFIRTERLLTVATGGSALYSTSTGLVSGSGSDPAGFRRCLAWAQDGLLATIGMDIKSRVDERNDKSYATQAYAAMSMGACRMEEVKVVSILCDESK